MNATVLNLYIQGLVSVFSPLGMDLERKHFYRHDSPYHDQSLLIISKMVGEVEGEILISVPEETLPCFFYSLQMPFSTDPKDVEYVLEEVGKKVREHTMSNYQQAGVQLDIRHIHFQDKNQWISSSLKKVQSLTIKLTIQEEFPLHVHFVLGEDYKKCQLFRRIGEFAESIGYVQ
jgi:chemotaxis protein CheX